MTQLISNVLMQPNPNAVERPSLRDDKRFITVVYDCSEFSYEESKQLSDDLIGKMKAKKAVFAGVGYLVEAQNESD